MNQDSRRFIWIILAVLIGLVVGWAFFSEFAGFPF